jgi:hypothetical protein
MKRFIGLIRHYMALKHQDMLYYTMNSVKSQTSRILCMGLQMYIVNPFPTRTWDCRGMT